MALIEEYLSYAERDTTDESPSPNLLQVPSLGNNSSSTGTNIKPAPSKPPRLHEPHDFKGLVEKLVKSKLVNLII